jgi:hypothetical protein
LLIASAFFLQIDRVNRVVAIAAGANALRAPSKSSTNNVRSASNIAPSASTLTPLLKNRLRCLPLEKSERGKGETHFFAEGMQDELLSNLSKIKDLKVITALR